MSSFTPGPWKVAHYYQESPNRCPDGCYRVWCKEGFTVCKVRADAFPCDRKPSPRDEDAANARLIAAAPCLLAACEQMMEAFPLISVPVENNLFTPMFNARKALKAAIAKATGDEP